MMKILVKYKWIDHEQSIISQFANFWKQEMFIDCTILCRGEKFPVHRLVLASCSEYFKEVFDNAQCCHPIIIMNEISSEHLQILLNYIYQVNLVVPQRKLLVIAEEARALKIKGFKASNQLLSNTFSSAHIAENFRLLQKSLSPVVSITKLSGVHDDFSLKRKVLKEWDVGNKRRKSNFSCSAKVQVTKLFVDNKDTTLSILPETSDLKNLLDSSDEDEADFIGFDSFRGRNEDAADEKKKNVDGLFDDVKPDPLISPEFPSLEVYFQKPDEELYDEKIVKEELDIVPFSSQKSLNDTLPTSQSTVEHSPSSEVTKLFEGKIKEDGQNTNYSASTALQTHQRALEGRMIENDRFQIKFICVHKGRGVFAREEIPAGGFLFEYSGEIISKTEGETRLQKIGPNYLYFLGDICIDGNKDHICSLVNDDQRNPNAIMKRIGDDRIGLFVMKVKPIQPGEEITYCYADGFSSLPWRKVEENVNLFEKAGQDVQVEDSTLFCQYCRLSKERTRITPVELRIPRETSQIDYSTSHAPPQSDNASNPEQLKILLGPCTNTTSGGQQITSNVSIVDYKNSEELGILERFSQMGCTSDEQNSNFPSTTDSNNPVEPDISQQSYDVDCSDTTSDEMTTHYNPPTIDLYENVEIVINANTNQEQLNIEAPQYVAPAPTLEQTDLLKNEKIIKISSQKSSVMFTGPTESSCRRNLFIETKPNPLKPKKFKSKNMTTPLKLKPYSVTSSPKWSPFKTVITEINETEVEQKKKTKRRKRPCFFCGKFLHDLKEHLCSVHKNEQPVAEALKLPQKLRREAFALLKKKGIELVNHERLANGEELLTEQIQKGTQISQCNNCYGYYALRGILQHKKKCHKNKLMVRNEGIKKCLAYSMMMKKEVSRTIDKDFQHDILGHLHQDASYQIILNSNEIQICGIKLFEKLRAAKKDETNLRKRVRSHIRRLANILLKFNNHPKFRNVKQFTLSEIFNTARYKNFSKLMIDMIYKPGDGKRLLKEGTATKYLYTILDAIHALISFYTVNPVYNSQLVKSLKNFETLLRRNKARIFGEASQLTFQRQANKLPTNKDVELIISESSQIIDELGDPSSLKSEANFVLLRRAVCTRIIFFNGKKPREVATLSIKNWKLAKENDFIFPKHLEKETKAELNVLANFRIMFAVVKTSKVSVLVPKKLFRALDLLCDPEYREIACVSEENKYLFPSTKWSLQQTSVSADVHNFIRSCDFNFEVKSLQVRHMISTKFGWADHSEDSRKSLKRTTGNPQSLIENEETCQTPQALMAIEKIDSALAEIEQNAGFLQDVPKKDDDWEGCEEAIETPQKRLQMEGEKSLGSTSTDYISEICIHIDDNWDSSSDSESEERSACFTIREAEAPEIDSNERKQMSEASSAPKED